MTILDQCLAEIVFGWAIDKGFVIFCQEGSPIVPKRYKCQKRKVVPLYWGTIEIDLIVADEITMAKFCFRKIFIYLA